MILFFKNQTGTIVATESVSKLSEDDVKKLSWLYGEAELLDAESLEGYFVGPRREMITPWSTNAVEITQNMGLSGILRIEEYFPVKDADAEYDPMLQRLYSGLDQKIFKVDIEPQPILFIEDLESYNEQEGLALSTEEIEYLHKVEGELGRKLTDSEVFGFAQINSEHCRHKIFGGTFIIDGKEMESSLFQMIKKTTQENPNSILSAYKDNVAFSQGPVVEQFAPVDHSTSDYFVIKDIETVISLKAETHNFPTTVEPFNGASTGTGGEIRDRMGGGKGSWPIAGTAVYMTSYPRNDQGRQWEKTMKERNWLYQTPEQILIKASNGASDFGNKFGQPLICGSLLTFEHKENDEQYGYDKVIMLAGGVGYGTKRDCLKGEPQTGNKVVVLGGDNYRIGLGGGSVSSVETGRYSSGIELNAVQRANAEMQKRAYNVTRALCEEESNPIVSIHDHGSAGHVNCLSELVEECGGLIEMDKLPIGDKTLSAKEIVANESQERMGLLIDEKYIGHVQQIAERERAPMYVVGETTGDARFAFQQADGVRPFDLAVSQMFGSSPKTYMVDETIERKYENVKYSEKDLTKYIEDVLQLESVACKDWLTNKVDRSVTGKIARQQCQGKLQLPLSDCGVVALDYRGKKGIATAIGHAPQAALADSAAGSVLAVSEALTNIVFAPLTQGINSVSLSANWMWPCRSQKGEDARLYKGVKALSDFCIALGVNVPTGKDSLSMTQKYPNGEKIISPGTVIVSSGGEVSDVKKVVSPVLAEVKNSTLLHIDFSFDEQRLGGSAFAQSLGKIGSDVPTVKSAEYFADAFNAVQTLVEKELVLAGHDISAGGMIVTLLEMCFANVNGGLNIDLSQLVGDDIVKILFSENPGLILQIDNKKVTESSIETVWTKLVDANSSNNINITAQIYDEEAKEYRIEEHKLAASQYESNPVAFCDVLTLDEKYGAADKKIGYMVYLAFDHDYDDAMVDAIKELSKQGITDMILDLRANSGGHVTSSIMLASMLLDESYVGDDKVYARLKHNPKNTVYDDVDFTLDKFYSPQGSSAQYDLPNLGVKKLWVICSEFTASASEMLIVGLRGLDVEVELIGNVTEGKNCGMEVTYKNFDGYEYEFAPITFMNENGKGFSDYGDGITPEHNLVTYASNPALTDRQRSLCSYFPVPLTAWDDIKNDIALEETVMQICGKSLLTSSSDAQASASRFATTRAGGIVLPERINKKIERNDLRSRGMIIVKE